MHAQFQFLQNVIKIKPVYDSVKALDQWLNQCYGLRWDSMVRCLLQGRKSLARYTKEERKLDLSYRESEKRKPERTFSLSLAGDGSTPVAFSGKFNMIPNWLI